LCFAQNRAVETLRWSDTYLLLLAAGMGFALAVALGVWRARVRSRRRRMAGYVLLDCLKAYSAWMDYQREELFQTRDPEDLGTPDPLLRACEIKDEWFPQLSSQMVRLLHSHRQMMEYLWEQRILRLSQASARASIHSDPRYQQLRDLQDATMDGMFVRCRQLIGDSGRKWRPTRSDFAFSSGLSVPSLPSTRG
jgi:hypothetical protein